MYPSATSGLILRTRLVQSNVGPYPFVFMQVSIKVLAAISILSSSDLNTGLSASLKHSSAARSMARCSTSLAYPVNQVRSGLGRISRQLRCSCSPPGGARTSKGPESILERWANQRPLNRGALRKCHWLVVVQIAERLSVSACLPPFTIRAFAANSTGTACTASLSPLNCLTARIKSTRYSQSDRITR